MKRKVLLGMALVVAGAAAGGELHVKTGAKGGTGTAGAPLGSLTEARDAIRAARAAGNKEAWTVRLAPGVYPVTETVVFEPQDSGTPEAPIRYIGENGNTILAGGLRVPGWRQTADGFWEADIPALADGSRAYFENLYVNGRRAVRARHPNTGFLIPAAVMQTVLTNAETRAVYARAGVAGSAAELAPLLTLPEQEKRYAQLVVHHNWDTTRRMILDVTQKDDAVSIWTQGGLWKPWNPWRKTSMYYVENVRAAFDAPGEWFYDGARGKVLYRPVEGERPEVAEAFVAVPGLATLLAFKGAPEKSAFVSDITFENLALQYTDSPRRANQVTNCGIPAEVLGDPRKPGPTQFEPMQASAGTDAAIMADGAHRITFRDCEVAHTGEYGIWFRTGCVSNRFERCALTDLGAGGVRIGASGGPGTSCGSNEVVRALEPAGTGFNVVDNCIIKRGGRFHAPGVAVWVGHSPFNQITHNEISDHYYTGVSLGWVWGYRGSIAQGNTVAFNRIHKIGQRVLGDMGGVYTLGTSFGTCVSNNVIFDVDSYTYGGWGLYPDEGTEGIVMENNLVYDTKDSSFHQHYGRDNLIRNNILCCSRECQVAVTRVENHRSAIIEGNIIYWEKGPTFSPRYYGSEKAQMDWSRNLWWRRDEPVDFGGKRFAEWQAMGRDKDGLVADPLFVDPDKRDFRLRPESPASKIGFKPFDFNKAGVYGDEAWIRRAQEL